MASVIEGSGQLQTKKQPPRVPLLVIPTAYAVLGAMTTIVNKIILSSYDFPCTFLMLACQLCVSLAICIAYSKYPVERQLLSPPKWSTTTFRACLPLSLVFVSNVAFGFFGLQALTVSMFVSLRRLSILTILAVEVWLLRVVPSRTTLVACTIIVIGVIVASMHDIMFDLWGYIAVFLNNMFTAMYWSMSNKVLNNTDITLLDLTATNAFFGIQLSLLVAGLRGEFQLLFAFPHVFSYCFWLAMLLSSLLAVGVTVFAVASSKLTSPTSTSIAGKVKDTALNIGDMSIAGFHNLHIGFVIGVFTTIFGTGVYMYGKWQANVTSFTKFLCIQTDPDVETQPRSCHSPTSQGSDTSSDSCSDEEVVNDRTLMLPRN